MQRVSCVICESPTLESFYTIEKFPLTACSTEHTSELDIFNDLVFKVCKDCRCVQLTSLVDPVTLYADDNKTALTPLWKKHHTQFTAFIESAADLGDVCEIGGGSNPLVQFFSSPPPYSVMDLYECPNKVPSITYTIGNCETFTEYTTRSVILSHTFEHLYEPRKFLDSIRASGVKNVFISVPNFAAWLAKHLTTSILFNQHTFYFEQRDIETLFALYGFETVRSEVFGDHSLFFHFQRGAPAQLPILRSPSDTALFRHFDNRVTHIRALELNEQVYIMPSFYVGQIVYHYIRDKDKVIGFLDNDTNKIGKRLYGTPLSTYSPSVLASSSKTVIVARTPYYNEMIHQLKTINSDINVVTIELN
jgi:hypothetical protein